jgi:hypothetical protein
MAADRAPNTYRSYAERLKRHVLPALGRLKLRLIHRAHIKALLAEKRGQGHSTNSVRLMKAPPSALLPEAVDDGIIPVNPALQLGRRLGNRADKLTQSQRVQRIRPMSWEQRQAGVSPSGSFQTRSAGGWTRPRWAGSSVRC